MPAKSPKQQRFMGAKLAQQRKTGSNSTGMSETQLSDFAGSKVQKTRTDKPGRSIIDVESHKRAPEQKTIEGGRAHPLHSGYGVGVSKPIEYGSDSVKYQDGKVSTPGNKSALRDIGNGVHFGGTIDFYGPDTDFRVEEINPHHYGRDYEPAPFKDLFKTEEKAEEAGIRLREEYEYSEIATPGSVPDSGIDSSLAYGAISYTKVSKSRDVPDHRSFEEQQKYRRSQAELEEDAPTVKNLKKL